MTKPWRMVSLHIGAWITLGLLWFGSGKTEYGGLTVLDWTNLVVVAGCLETIVVRLVRIVRTLKSESKPSPGDRPAGS